MTQEQWFAESNPDKLLAFVSRSGRPIARDRRCRLFACACARSVWQLLPTDARSALQISERLAEGHATPTDMLAAAVRLPEVTATPTQCAIAAAGWASGAIPWFAWPNPHDGLQFSPAEAARLATRAIASTTVGRAPPGPSTPEWWHRGWNRVYHDARARQAAILRDIFPPPGDAPRLDREWLTSTVSAIARQMDQTGDFSAAPILADALQDAGCTDETVLQCCRAAGTVHVRGNWVVDLVMGRE
jgi:hypothetical protein